ncbi:hypothetical protein FH972_027283 [Carpinus fangiana]|uniref:Thaumatin-like protein n=1 Tax=Carpinus fangiana TaxID=176857 RepID=A0A5N6LEH7_9ROSI|nr:hypothetical protein FH972_027283 [Carpinus fangiana]
MLMLALQAAAFGLEHDAILMAPIVAVAKPVTAAGFSNAKPTCPNELKAPGDCNNPCTVFKTDQYCCNSGSCEPIDFSKFFKDRCPDAYSYPKDDQTSTFTCPGGTNYKVVFCP